MVYRVNAKKDLTLAEEMAELSKKSREGLRTSRKNTLLAIIKRRASSGENVAQFVCEDFEFMTDWLRAEKFSVAIGDDRVLMYVRW